MQFNCEHFFKILLVWGMISMAGITLPFSAMGVEDGTEIVTRNIKQKWTGDYDKRN